MTESEERAAEALRLAQRHGLAFAAMLPAIDALANLIADARASSPPVPQQGAETMPHVPAGQIVWPTMPARKNQSSVLFEDGYDEGYARCLSDCKAAFASMQAEAPQATKDAEDAT